MTADDMNSSEEQRLELERMLALRQFEREQAAAARPGLQDRLRLARGKTQAAVAHPGDALEGAVRLGVKTIATGAVRGGRAVLGGLADSQKELMSGDKPIIDLQPAVAASADDGLDWFERQYAKWEARAGKIASSKRSFLMQTAMACGHAGWWVWHRASETYPYTLRPFAFAARHLRNRLDHKIERQGRATNWQKLRRRLYGMGPTKGMLAKFRYAAINIVSVPLAVLTIADASYNLIIQDYNDVHVAKINTQSSDVMYEYRIDGYQRLSNGQRRHQNLDIRYSIWHPFTYPRDVAAEIEEHQLCNFRAYGIPAVLPDVGIILWTSNELRQWVNGYPIVIEAHCRPDPDYYRPDNHSFQNDGSRMKSLSGTADGTFVPTWHASAAATARPSLH